MPQQPSQPEAPRAERGEPSTPEQDRTDLSLRARAALVELARLLGRQAAREQMRSQDG